MNRLPPTSRTPTPAVAARGEPSSPAVTPQLSTLTPQPPSIPDHELLRPIGGGSYGEVWLARTALGAYRAVKIVHRHNFGHDRPFEREFAGIQKFEPISRSHEGLVDLLQVGRNDAAGYFYYVMELADDAGDKRSTGARECWSNEQNPTDHHSTTPPLQHPASYTPRTLRSLLRSDPQPSTLNPQPTARLPLDECIQLGLSLTDALAFLHGQGLVHRDIKPSNIIFVGGVPKLADVGLVAGVGDARSYVGTEGFIPPEGPGSPQADLYSLGIVLYMMSTGKNHHDFPEPLPDLAEQPDHARWLEFNAVVHKACVSDVRERYQNAEEMHAELALLQTGQSVKRQRAEECRLALAKKLSLSAATLVLLVTGGLLFSNRFAISTHMRPSAAPGANSIAVVHFDKERRQFQSWYLNQSLAAGLCTALTNIAGLRVAPLAGPLAIRNNTNEAPEIGRQLGVPWVLQTVFYRDPDSKSRAQVAAKLTHLPDGILVWSADYDRTFGDLGAIQRDVLANVARALGENIPSAATERMETNLTHKVATWQLALRGGEQLHLGTREGFTEGVKLLHQVIEMDPTYAYPHWMLAWGYSEASEWHLPPHQAMPEARTWASRTLALDNAASFARCLLGDVKFRYDWDLEGAEKALRSAIESDPNTAANHAHYAALLQALGRLPEARAEQELATRLDPSDLSYVVGLANQAIVEKNYDAALKVIGDLLAIHPDHLLGHYTQGRTYERQGQYDQAMREYRWVQAVEDGPDVLAVIGHLHALRGEPAEARRLLGELETLGKSRYVAPIFKARIHLRLGDRLKALAMLEQARDDHCGSLTTLKLDDDWDSLRDEPRFQALLKQVGLTK